MSVEGIARLKAQFAKLGRGLLTAAHPAMLDGAAKVVETAKLIVPSDTGELRSTITHSGIMKTRRAKNDMVEISAGDARTIVGKAKQFQLARIIEFGTHHVPAQPFMRPAMRRHQRTITAAMRRAIRDQLEKDL
jgi:HK97 gp10 family phage protein